MAKVQSFADKAKGKKKVEGVTVKVIKSMKTDGGAYKFNEKFVKLADISKVTDIKIILAFDFSIKQFRI